MKKTMKARLIEQKWQSLDGAIFRNGAEMAQMQAERGAFANVALAGEFFLAHKPGDRYATGVSVYERIL